MAAPSVSSAFVGADPYEAYRDNGHVIVDRAGQTFPLVVNFEELRRVAKDWRTFTSDTPFEVPIPHEHGVRSVRQLPIEVDPPLHAAMRALTDPAFSRRAVEQHAEVVAGVVERSLAAALAKGRLDVVDELALPTVNHALAAALGRPAADAEMWLSWGTMCSGPPEVGGSGRTPPSTPTSVESWTRRSTARSRDSSAISPQLASRAGR